MVRYLCNALQSQQGAISLQSRTTNAIQFVCIRMRNAREQGRRQSASSSSSSSPSQLFFSYFLSLSLFIFFVVGRARRRRTCLRRISCGASSVCCWRARSTFFTVLGRWLCRRRRRCRVFLKNSFSAETRL